MTSQIDLNEEDLKDCLEEMKPLLAIHWKEVAAYQDKIALDPDYERYLKMEAMDLIRTYVLRHDGKMVGYWVFFVSPHPHYKADRFAVNDIVYVDPEYRRTDLTPACFKAVESQLKAEGVSVVTYHMKTYKPFEVLLKGLGYDHLEHLYGKYLKD